MIDIGFYHPERGYWVGIGIEDQEHLDALLVEYPEGTIQMPPSPGVDYQVDNGHWVYVAPLPVVLGPYQLAKTTPWKRMTDAEADLVYAAMQLTTPRLRGIYDAAVYIGSDDDLFPMLEQIITEALGGNNTRAKELLAREV